MIHMGPRILLVIVIHFCLGVVRADQESIRYKGPDHALERSRALLSTCPVEALKEARRALDISDEDGNRPIQLEALRAIANAELALGMNAEFMQTALRYTQAAEELGDPIQIAAALQHLSMAYRLDHQFGAAIMEARKALAMVLPLNDRHRINEAHLFLMGTLLQGGHHAEALSSSSQALDHCGDDAHCSSRVHHLMSQVLIDQGKFADALPFLTKAERVLNEVGTDQERLQLSLDRGRAMLGMGLTHFANEALKKAGDSPALKHDMQRKYELLQLRYQLALALEDWRTALGHLQRINALTDSTRSAGRTMRLAGLDELHEEKDRDKANAHLRDLNARQAETIQDQRSSNRSLLFMLAGLVILALALFLISRYTVKMMRRLARKNEVIRRQNEEIQSKVLELKRQNLRLAESLMSEEEKELILKEIHHRVKNNLQVVDSLLNIRSNEVHDHNSLRLLKEARGRIRSMAMVHEHIYRSSGDMHATLRAHIEKLGRSVLVAHGVHDRISIGVDTDLHTFPVETLLPLSLMLNELLTNSIKHAFADTQAGNIRIMIKPLETGYELRYSDDGHGMENGMNEAGTFGHELIAILAQQLNGKVQLLKTAGVVFNMTFTPDKELLRTAV